jgi:transposase
MGEMRMSSKERKRLGIMARIDAGEIRLKDASNILGISYRQIKRIRVRYRQHGDAGLVHQNRGRPSNHKYPDEIKDLVKKLYTESYNDFGPVLFSEKLSENHKIKVDHETLRRWLISEGLWQKKVVRASFKEAAQGAFWGTDTYGRQFLQLVWRRKELPDGHGG